MRARAPGTRFAGLGAAVVLLLGASCSDQAPPAADSTRSPTPDAASGVASSAPPAPPRVGACYVLDVSAALEITNSDEPVACSSKHTAVTVQVGRIDPVLDGHLLAIGSARVQRQIAERCRSRVDTHVGGSREAQRLSRVQAVWFSPSPQDADRGALWFRCDLVVAAGPQILSNLPRKTRNLLESPGSSTRYGTCGTAAPSQQGFRRVLCSAKHTWRARATITLPVGTTYLAKAPGKAADSTCRDIASRLTTTVSTLRWSFEWPTRAQWRAGQRYGLCWTPDS